MRIACIHIPQYALQCATRLDPALRGAAIAAVSSFGAAPARGGASVLHAPIVVACSRAAWALGVRLGMTATAARQLSAQVTVVNVDPAVERETTRAIAEVVLGVIGVRGGGVDLGGRVATRDTQAGPHLAMYSEVPTKTRGASFGERVLERLEVLGLTGRVGIADDRFTAWVAAAHIDSDAAGSGAAGSGATAHVTMVPRGGSAAFLAPRPLSLLAISPEVQHMLEALGVRTLGEFAALPAPSVARPLDADYRALARGESGTLLRPYAPEAAIREDIIVSAGNVLDAPDGMGAISGPTAIALVARRIALRLAGRGRAAARVEIVRSLDVGSAGTGATSTLELAFEHPLVEAEDLARAFGPALDTEAAGAWRLRVVVTGESVAGASEVGDDTVTLSQELAVPTIELAMAGRHVVLPAQRSALLRGPAEPDLAIAAATRASESLATAARTGTPTSAEPLAIVLSTPGTLFSLSSGERERPHRRLRRAKSRMPRRARAITVPGQSRLFDRG